MIEGFVRMYKKKKLFKLPHPKTIIRKKLKTILVRFKILFSQGSLLKIIVFNIKFKRILKTRSCT